MGKLNEAVISQPKTVIPKTRITTSQPQQGVEVRSSSGGEAHLRITKDTFDLNAQTKTDSKKPQSKASAEVSVSQETMNNALEATTPKETTEPAESLKQQNTPPPKDNGSWLSRLPFIGKFFGGH